jgi:hypothetical protein
MDGQKRIFVLIVLSIFAFYPVRSNADLWDQIKSKTYEISGKAASLFKSDENHTLKKMGELQNHSAEYLTIKGQERKAPEKSWFGKTKEDYRQSADEILKEVEATLFDEEIVGLARTIRDRNKNIKGLEDNIARLRESKILALAENKEKEAKETDQKIAEIQKDIQKLEADIVEIEKTIALQFKVLGVDMTSAQINTLCMRIDGDDIIKSVTMYQILKEILVHTQNLMTANSDNMDFVKKYYGVYVLLSETIVYAQTKYIKKNSDVWILKLEVLKSQAENVARKTRDSLAEITDPRRSSVLERNIESNLFTTKVIDLYKKELVRQREKVEQARKQAMQDVIVAWSSYETASVSAELVSTIDQADKAFENIIRMEVPEIVVFENAAVKNKFSELTTKLSMP